MFYRSPVQSALITDSREVGENAGASELLLVSLILSLILLILCVRVRSKRIDRSGVPLKNRGDGLGEMKRPISDGNPPDRHQNDGT